MRSQNAKMARPELSSRAMFVRCCVAYAASLFAGTSLFSAVTIAE